MRFSAETKVGFFVLISLSILAYMALQLDALRFNLQKYKHYYINFNDLSGLEKKADVKVAGVKIGWIDNIELIQNSKKAKVDIVVQGRYLLYSDASASICQDSILSNKYIAINPGSIGNILQDRAMFEDHVKASASIEQLLNKFDAIASNIQIISESIKNSCTDDNAKILQAIVENINDASKKIAQFSNVLTDNQSNLNQIIQNITNLTNSVLPAGKDINKLKDNLDSTLQSINSITKKVDEGKGLIGKIINEDCVYVDIKEAATQIKAFSNTAKKIGLVFDTHFEVMTHKAENCDFTNFKTYLDFRIHTKDELFFLFELLQTRKGTMHKAQEFNRFFSQNCKEFKKHDCAFQLDKTIVERNTFKFGFQVGRVWADTLAFRLGLFESSLGCAVDLQLPFKNDFFRWVTSLEAFDFGGQDRVCDARPHLKWINRIFFSKNFYFDFGADDFISKCNSTMFFGLGFRFGNEDLRYFLPA